MKQETTTVGPVREGPWDIMSGQTLVALLALVGTRRMGVEALRDRTKLTPYAFGRLLSWLQREYLVDVVSTLDGGRIEEKAELRDKGEAFLVSMLEKTCELPELQ
jgi:hypothetical protein